MESKLNKGIIHNNSDLLEAYARVERGNMFKRTVSVKMNLEFFY